MLSCLVVDVCFAAVDCLRFSCGAGAESFSRAVGITRAMSHRRMLQRDRQRDRFGTLGVLRACRNVFRTSCSVVDAGVLLGIVTTV